VLIDSQVLERYSSSATTNGDEQHPECFPVLRLASGEKIVVDFENDDVCHFQSLASNFGRCF